MSDMPPMKQSKTIYSLQWNNQVLIAVTSESKGRNNGFLFNVQPSPSKTLSGFVKILNVSIEYSNKEKIRKPL